jgi:hypothetical protein
MALRMAAFMPEQSPPLVKIPIRLMENPCRRI